MNRIVIVFVLGILLTSPLFTMDIVVAISANPQQLHGMTAQRFTQILQSKLEGEHRVKFYHSSQLGKDKDLMQKLKIGTVHLSMPSSGMSSVTPEFALFDMPFIIKNRIHVQKVEKEIFWSKIAPKAEKKGYRVIAFWENGIRHISNNKNPINQPADLKGIKLRTPKSSWRVAMFKNWGASPTPMSFSEVFVGLQTGVIDGQENPLGTIWGGKLHEVQKYVSLTGHVYIPAYLTAGKKVWDKLPWKVKQSIKAAAEEVRPWMYREGEKMDQNLIRKLENAGVQINIANRQKFVDSSTPIYKKFRSKVPDGKYLIDETLKLAN